MVDAAGPEEVRTGLVADALRHHLRLIAVCALLGLALGYGLGVVSSTTYTSKAAVLVTPLLGNPFSPDGSGNSLTNLETEAQLVRSDVLARTVEGITAVPSDELQRHLTVSVPVNTQIVDIAYTSSDADQAETVVNAYADAYLDARQNSRDDVVSSQATGLEQQINETQRKLQDALSKAPTDRYQAKLAQTLTGQLASLRIQLAQVSGSSTNPGEVISPGTKASNPNGLSQPLLLAGGLLLGLAVAALMAVSRERASHVLRHLDQVEYAGLPVLGVIKGDREEDRAAVYRHVRASLGSSLRGSVAVGATTSAPVAGVVAAELATSYTHSPESVALVDASGIATAYLAPGLGSAAPGLSDVLLDRVRLDEAVVRVPSAESEAVFLLPPGTDVDEGAERYVSEHLSAVLATLHARYGPVLISTRGLSEPDGSSLAGRADAAVVVVVLNETTYPDIATAREWLLRSGTELAGAIVVLKLGRKSPLTTGRATGPTTAFDRQEEPAASRSPSADAPEPDELSDGSAALPHQVAAPAKPRPDPATNGSGGSVSPPPAAPPAAPARVPAGVATSDDKATNGQPAGTPQVAARKPSGSSVTPLTHG